jgi:hypothetical protein
MATYVPGTRVHPLSTTPFVVPYHKPHYYHNSKQKDQPRLPLSVYLFESIGPE